MVKKLEGISFLEWRIVVFEFQRRYIVIIQKDAEASRASLHHVQNFQGTRHVKADNKGPQSQGPANNGIIDKLWNILEHELGKNILMEGFRPRHSFSFSLNATPGIS
jgi:hypothetical protein